MDNILTLSQIENQFDSEWILVSDPQTDESLDVKGGIVLWHSHDRNEVYQKELMFMNPSETIATQVKLSKNLYHWLERQAQFKGHSVEDEIAEVLMAAVGDDNLSAEFAQWEAASDEDALEFEALLAAEEV